MYSPDKQDGGSGGRQSPDRATGKETANLHINAKGETDMWEAQKTSRVPKAFSSAFNELKEVEKKRPTLLGLGDMNSDSMMVGKKAL